MRSAGLAVPCSGSDPSFTPASAPNFRLGNMLPVFGQPKRQPFLPALDRLGTLVAL
jgi:hypothetical protein